MKGLLVSLVALVAMGGLAQAQTAIKPAIVYANGGKFDKSFNEGVFNGATKFAKDTGVAFRDLEIQNDAQREQVLRKFAKEGFSPILMPGFAWATALGKIADEFPKTKFGIIDMVVDKPNVQSMVFKAEEGSFLVGVIAAKTSKTGKVGFVGGMDIPLISAFGCGYAQGVKHVSDKDAVIANMTGTTPSAWNDPVKGGELAKAQISQGADIVFAAAGATGQGVLKAAADAGKSGIGVDSDQDDIVPGKVLTSMIKHVDVAVFDVARAIKEKKPLNGHLELGLADQGISLSDFRNTREKIGADRLAHLDAIQAAIIRGRIHVPSTREELASWKPVKL